LANKLQNILNKKNTW